MHIENHLRKQHFILSRFPFIILILKTFTFPTEAELVKTLSGARRFAVATAGAASVAPPFIHAMRRPRRRLAARTTAESNCCPSWSSGVCVCVYVLFS